MVRNERNVKRGSGEWDHWVSILCPSVVPVPGQRYKRSQTYANFYVKD